MPDRWLCCNIVLLSVALFAADKTFAQIMPASATTAVPPAIAPTDIRHLEIGDSYRVSVERQGVKKEYDGQLVKANARWLVLKSVVEGRSERSVPVLSKTPYVNRFFRSVGIGRANQFRWIPRDAATIVGRIVAADKSGLEAPEGENPKDGVYYMTDVVQDGKVVDGYSTITLDDQHLTCHLRFNESRVRPWPVLGRLPVVGSSFSTQTTRLVEKDLQFAWDEVLCVTDTGTAPPVVDN